MGISEMLAWITRQYPPLAERASLPPLHMPAAYAAVLLGYFVGPGPAQTFCVTHVLLLLAAFRPFYTTGDVVSDYTMSSTFFVMWIAYLDHGLKGEGSPRYVGRPDRPLPGGGVGERDSETWVRKLGWAVRLTTTPRGIGWDWQVKNVPPHPGANQPRLRFVWEQVVEVVWRTALKALAVYTIGFCKAVQPSVTSSLSGRILDATVAWCGAVWSWNTIGAANAAGAAITALLGICEPWEWPPVFGALGDAWSVRQVWSTSYHQIMRRAFQTPGLRLARFLGLKKGTFGSRYLQLYSTFFISFCVHWWQSFIVTRHDNGEFAFFMLQPVIISAEDLLQWIWRKSVDPKRKKDLARLETLVGYVWTIAAFTFTLRHVMGGWIGIGLVGGGGPDEKAALQLGRQHGVAYLGGW
ncbi:hypothetical protein F4781DRAFT_336972 [Annulohypoxylon bovei var. microspora]|nr:hypothetical protein F4781DRAFT_336972 [Annulohypoxylon bovei var. microspora]